MGYSGTEETPGLRDYMKELLVRFGRDGELATYEALAGILGVSPSLIGNLRAGRASKRETTIDMADRARLPRCEFLRASGYVPHRVDREWDADHYGTAAVALKEALDNRRTEGPEPAHRSSLLEMAARALGGEIVSRMRFVWAGSVSAGRLTPQDDLSADEVSEHSAQAYLCRVNGSSMPPFEDGSTVIMLESFDATIGEYVVAQVGGEFVFKQLAERQDNGHKRRYLHATNGDHRDIFEEFEIVGRVIDPATPIGRVLGAL